MTIYHHKIVLLGDSSVGKSCISCRFVNNDFNEFQEPTIGAAYLTKEILINDKKIKYEIWDTAGQERYRSLAPMYYRGSSAAIVVYDVTQKDSLVGAKTWINEIKRKTKNCYIILVGNKSDLLNEKKNYYVNLENVRTFAENNNIKNILVSAKTGENVEDIFIDIGKKLSTENKIQKKNYLKTDNYIEKKRSGWC
jgi:small GTP-binding protein